MLTAALIVGLAAGCWHAYFTIKYVRLRRRFEQLQRSQEVVKDQLQRKTKRLEEFHQSRRSNGVPIEDDRP